MKIGFVTDTNIIRKDDDKLSEGMILDTTDIFIEYIDALKKIDTNHTLIYFMPDLIFFSSQSCFTAISKNMGSFSGCWLFDSFKSALNPL